MGIEIKRRSWHINDVPQSSTLKLEVIDFVHDLIMNDMDIDQVHVGPTTAYVDYHVNPVSMIGDKGLRSYLEEVHDVLTDSPWEKIVEYYSPVVGSDELQIPHVKELDKYKNVKKTDHRDGHRYCGGIIDNDED